MTTDAFQNAYQKLNTEQKHAVDTIEGPVMVIAGPGTGKTQVLTLRIANILLQTDTDPENILALTFTESGAYAMRARLVELIGSDAYKITITTFHGFCNDLISAFPDEFPRIIGATTATEVDQITIIEHILDTHEITHLKPYGNPAHYVRSILAAIRHLKREGITPERWQEVAEKDEAEFYQNEDLYNKTGAYAGRMKGKYQTHARQIEKNKELATLYAAYEEALFEKGLYDFEDMILEVLGRLRDNPDFLLTLQETYHYMLVDEHQDTNNAQNAVLELLCQYHESPNLFIVGDERQAIYRFQGASLENFLYFTNRFADVTLITLTKNYRSQQTVLDAAQSAMIHSGTETIGADTALAAQTDIPNAPVAIYAFTRPEFEFAFLTQDIAQKIADGVPPEEIAVFYRTNREATDIVRALEKANISFSLESNEDLLTDADIRIVVSLFRTVHAFGDETHLTRLLFTDVFNIEPLDVYKILSHKNKERKNIFDVMRSGESLKVAGVSDPEKCFRAYKDLKRWKRIAEQTDVLTTAETILRESGFLSALLAKEGAFDRLAKLDSLFDEMKRLIESRPATYLADFLVHIDVLQTHGIMIPAKHAPLVQGVRLMTAHKAKGQEFDHVYIVGAYDGHWGGRRSRSDFYAQAEGVTLAFSGDDQDERRLFYVALTRARKTLSVSYAQENAEGKHRLPSRFIEEIDPQHRTDIDTTPYEEAFTAHPETQYAERTVVTPHADDAAYIRSLVLEQGLSITALNNYLACPWQYFYENLLRIPRGYTKTQMYGIAIHEALKSLFDVVTQGESAGKAYTLHAFERALSKQPLSDTDYAELKEKGEHALSGYIDTYSDNWSTDVVTEMNVAGIPFEVTEADGSQATIHLRGKIDKIEGVQSGRVNVVDYKTAKPKSRNALEGNTKTDSGNEKRQLVFYKLLLDHYTPERFVMETGEIDFVEPDKNGRYKKERFTITEEDLTTLKKEIAEAVTDILRLGFWNRTCEDKTCQYCALRADMLEKKSAQS